MAAAHPPRTERRAPRPALVGALLAAICLLPFVVLAFSRILIIDDAFITYRYSYHLARGDGLVFNPGERVEGSTSFLWTVLLAIPSGLGWPVDSWAAGIGLACAVGATLATWRAARALGLSPLVALWAPAGLAIVPGYWLVAANGMEGGLTTLLIALLLLALVARRPAWAGLCGGVLFLARPDALSVLPVCALYILACGGDDRRARLRALAALLAPWLAIAGGITVWRLAYYGAPLPNTVAAKSPPAYTAAILGPNLRDGALYWGHFAVEVAPLTLGALLGLLVARRRAVALLCAGMVAAQLPSTLINGGDWIPHERLLIVYLPALALPLAQAAAWVGAVAGRPQGGLWRWGAAAILVAACALPLGANRWEPTPALRVNQQGIICTDYRLLAQTLAPALAPGDRLSPEALGIFSYLLPNTYSHDFLGLTDSYLARHGTSYWAQIGKSDLEYSYRVIRPTLFIFHSGRGFPDDLYFHTYGRFDAEYAAFTLRSLKSCPPGTTIAVIRRDALARLLPPLERFAPQPLILGQP